VLSADYNEYMDIQQSIYLKIHKAFEQASIEFAYPTQTLHIMRGDAA
jgi:small-conductance mechanosensitive channel